ncbi:unnamed protein product [Trichogramma brassicae]|uniref:Uncharacterized protein n=1 Tax=Trichogramma brassicae TaxID=86971 RepID=A0A6H5IWT6_9HYME|nr:unnamed protein product [Trichogramma brassicae]
MSAIKEAQRQAIAAAATSSPRNVKQRTKHFDSTGLFKTKFWARSRDGFRYNSLQCLVRAQRMTNTDRLVVLDEIVGREKVERGWVRRSNEAQTAKKCPTSRIIRARCKAVAQMIGTRTLRTERERERERERDAAQDVKIQDLFPLGSVGRSARPAAREHHTTEAQHRLGQPGIALRLSPSTRPDHEILADNRSTESPADLPAGQDRSSAHRLSELQLRRAHTPGHGGLHRLRVKGRLQGQARARRRGPAPGTDSYYGRARGRAPPALQARRRTPHHLRQLPGQLRRRADGLHALPLGVRHRVRQRHRAIHSTRRGFERGVALDGQDRPASGAGGTSRHRLELAARGRGQSADREQRGPDGAADHRVAQLRQGPTPGHVRQSAARILSALGTGLLRRADAEPADECCLRERPVQHVPEGPVEHLLGGHAGPARSSTRCCSSSGCHCRWRSGAGITF